MGLFSKLRDMLTYEDEVDEQDAVRKEVSTVEIPSPEVVPEKKKAFDFEITEKEEEIGNTKKVPKIDSFVDNTKEVKVVKEVKPVRLVKEVEKPAFTIFTDSDFEVMEKRKEERKPYSVKEIDSHKFKPTPTISPVYGIISDEIEEKKPVPRSSFTREDVTLDDVRKKAFGSLEDELESNLFSTKELTLDDSASKNDIFDEVDNALDERDNDVVSDGDSAIGENDLFNLIDSMYERKDD